MNEIMNTTLDRISPDYNDKSDDMLVSQINQCERISNNTLMYLIYRRHVDFLRKIFEKYADGKGEFSDFMAELDIKLSCRNYHALQSYHSSSSFKTWLGSVARNLMLDMVKREGVPMIDIDDIEVVDAVCDNDRMAKVMEALNNLSNDDSRYVIFKELEGYTPKEIADMLNEKMKSEQRLKKGMKVSVAYVYTLKSRAISRMQSVVNPDSTQDNLCIRPVISFLDEKSMDCYSLRSSLNLSDDQTNAEFECLENATEYDMVESPPQKTVTIYERIMQLADEVMR